ncbi:carbohydrate-binding module family 48 protein [Laetiporus sulphureus 93-53]|uniref:Carbohydrate-binding module family 48 protein n=1 Tax=Laetiporus sulphureus 93-53 TaxID=1314785 RepID=A0A165HLG7_9APHY|nr:carbohydrate-binding module family 48 protein [Laetiporus sulphureus 93-53]KZT11886.1 carbohydrate-binding module family 48 protein [Laetiporus sulphureus 93-53]
MGNTPSNPASQSYSHHSPVRRGSPARPSSSASQRVHRSLRTKKKSLELPDLAFLALTPASSSPSSVSPHGAYRRPRASSPIPIPTAAHPPQPTFRPQNNLPSAAHVPLANNNQESSGVGRGARPKSSYLTSAYPSTRSFMAKVQEQSPPRSDPTKHVFVPEVVHSTLPLVLVKPEEDIGHPEPVSVKIVWRGSGKSVVLARAGDDNWQGRQSMDYESATDTWLTFVSLLPGTHHLKFIVDDQWKISDEYPTAVDDRDGSLANYVAVPFPSSASSPQTVTAPTSGSVSPLASPHHGHPHAANSFWSDSSSAVGANGVVSGADGRSRAHLEWTTEIPPELTAAAQEEEQYLALTDNHEMSSNSSASGFIPAPNIPPAPQLPRHLDKLILNVRPSNVSGSPVPAERERSRKSSKDKIRRDRDRDSRSRPSNLSVTSSTAVDPSSETDHVVLSPLGLPVVTASGTDVTAGLAPLATTIPDGGPKLNGAVAKLDFTGLADDTSVLPVPSHVVLHHLSTSAIKNGVLAVANTTRYRKKYITTIYYKPT